MRIYVATKWENRGRAQEVMGMLEALGHTITYDWTTSEQNNITQAQLDKRGVLTANTVVVLAETDFPFKGTFVEMGMAIAIGIPVIIVGAFAHNIFENLPIVTRVDSIADLLDSNIR